MRLGRVVVLLPNTGDAFGVVERVKLVDTGALVRVPAVEKFDDRFRQVFPGGMNTNSTSMAHSRGAIERIDEVFCGERVLHFPAQLLSGVFIDEGENFEWFPGHGPVELGISGPHIPWAFRFGDGGHVRNPRTFLAAPHDYPEVFFAPQTLSFLMIHRHPSSRAAKVARRQPHRACLRAYARSHARSQSSGVSPFNGLRNADLASPSRRHASRSLMSNTGIT